ncbi:hypothetical protein QBC46DRAFT_439276, partial [Diplogelasinospora grovesii]
SPQASINITNNTTNVNSNNTATITKTNTVGSHTTMTSPKLTSPLAEHLSTLPQRMREAKQSQLTRQEYNDFQLVTSMIPLIEAFLLRLPDIQPHPSRAELTLVPLSAVPLGWEL